MEIFYRVKNMEFFKDGTVLGSRQLKPGEVLIVSELEKQKIEQSGGILEVIESLVKNPLKKVEDAAPVENPVEVATVEKQEVVVPEKKKAGRPKKVVNA